MNRSFLNKLVQKHQQCPTCPSLNDVVDFYSLLLGLLFPDFERHKLVKEHLVSERWNFLATKLSGILEYQSHRLQSDKVVKDFFDRLPVVLESIEEDVVAMYEGDPAAKSKSEVIRTYPGFYAIAAYRVANELYRLGVREVPRMITEHAHSHTGIDIHPAATIGKYFCIDHGTGVVIGETTVIGSHVKIYQSVTLGALSVSKEDAERKRHPTIGDHVVIYAGATILGGDTAIGSGSVIGGNVWLTRSIPPNSKVYYQARMSDGVTGEADLIVFKQDAE